MATDRVYVAGMALMTAEELLHTSIPNKRTELVRGVLVVRKPAGFRHGAVSAALTRLLGAYVATHRLGLVLAAETGFHIEQDPDTVRASDVGFVRQERWRACTVRTGVRR